MVAILNTLAIAIASVGFVAAQTGAAAPSMGMSLPYPNGNGTVPGVAGQTIGGTGRMTRSSTPTPTTGGSSSSTGSSGGAAGSSGGSGGTMAGTSVAGGSTAGAALPTGGMGYAAVVGGAVGAMMYAL